MKKKRKAQIPNLKAASQSDIEKDSQGVVTQLLKDHKKMKALMKKIKSPRTSNAACEKTYKVLKMILDAHVKAEEISLLNVLKEHEKFDDMAQEGAEEHRLHETVIGQIDRTKDLKIKCVRIKIYCEMLEHHLKEEEEDLFPAFIKYTARSTRRKMGAVFRKERQKRKNSKEEKIYRKMVESRQSS